MKTLRSIAAAVLLGLAATAVQAADIPSTRSGLYYRLGGGDAASRAANPHAHCCPHQKWQRGQEQGGYIREARCLQTKDGDANDDHPHRDESKFQIGSPGRGLRPNELTGASG